MNDYLRVLFYSPRQIFARFLQFSLLLVFAVAFLKVPTAEAYFFKDVQGHWSADYFEKLHQWCGVDGYRDSSGSLLYQAKPDEALSRAELVQIMAKCLNKNLTTPSSNPFPDVDRSSWAAPAVSEAKNSGWVQGYTDGTFGPNLKIKRSEALKVMVRPYFTDSQIGNNSQTFFKDVTSGSWPERYVAFAYIKDFVQGLKNPDGSLKHEFGPDLNITRAEAAKIIVNIIEYLKDSENDLNNPYTDNPNNDPGTTDTTTDTTDTTTTTTTTDDQNTTNQDTNNTNDNTTDTTYNPAAANSHPSMWFTVDDVPRLRSWAVSSNPVYQDGLRVVAENAKKDMDDGKLSQDTGAPCCGVVYPREMYAMLFAYMANIENDPDVREDYAQRAKSLLMYMMNEAAKGYADGQPYRDPSFPKADRSHFWGEAFPLTVDWIYPYLSTEDKATIRKVFLMWEETVVTSAYTHPEPVNVLNDPAILHLDEPGKGTARFGGNNHNTLFGARVGMMAMALDEADDPNGELRAYLKNATGAWFYKTFYLLNNDFNPSNDPSDPYNGKSGDWFEGDGYADSGVGNIVHFFLALKTKGLDDTSLYGPQAKMLENSFFQNLVTSYISATTPVRTIPKDFEWWGLSYQLAYQGDDGYYFRDRTMKSIGPLGIYYSYVGNKSMYDKIRWTETYLAPGGKEKLTNRIQASLGSGSPRNAIFAFMLFDPSAAEPSDPRPSTPLVYYGKAMNRIYARTAWDPVNNSSNPSTNTRFFTYKLSWNKIDHQQNDGNMFEFYRKGEWLIKNRVGYGPDIASSAYHNTITIQNDPPESNQPGSYQNLDWQDGSQWAYISTGDPTLVARSFQNGYIFVTGDATNLYNSESDNATDVTHASRSILWLKPDYVVVYDRAATKTAGRFKRFWLNFQNQPIINGMQTTATTPNGQKIFVNTLLPQNATLSVDSSVPDRLGYSNDASAGEIMDYRLKVEATGAPQNTRFLHVIQGTDANASADSTAYITSNDNAFDGAVVGNTAVLFAVTLNNVPNSFSFTVPSSVTATYITGLTPEASYDTSVQYENDSKTVTVTTGGSVNTDEGGVLIVNNL